MIVRRTCAMLVLSLLLAMLDPNITLTEPVVFLRTSDPSGRLQRDWDDSPRAILTLNVVEPTGISSERVASCRR